MATINLKIGELRKQKGVSQQQLANVLGISFQSVSKWETNTTMPDITLLPVLAEYFNVTVDELLGLKPLSGECYIVSPTGTKDFWNERLEYLKRTRSTLWNMDYMQFLIEKVWQITKPINVLDCGCGYGFLGPLLIQFLPEGSTYTGIDFSEKLIKEGKAYFSNVGFTGELICEDLFRYKAPKQYDLVISQAVLRHVNNAMDFLTQMVELTSDSGLVVCIDVNREIECDGLFIKGIAYDYLCSREGFQKMWQKEYEHQGRDYAISMKVPDMMKHLGLSNIDIRINDKVSFVSPDKNNYDQISSDFIESQGWNNESMNEEEVINNFMNHGMDRIEAEFYCNKQKKISSFVKENKDNLTYTHILGLLISYGWKSIK